LQGQISKENGMTDVPGADGKLDLPQKAVSKQNLVNPIRHLEAKRR
jgi:hypothetical protein